MTTYFGVLSVIFLTCDDFTSKMDATMFTMTVSHHSRHIIHALQRICVLLSSNSQPDDWVCYLLVMWNFSITSEKNIIQHLFESSRAMNHSRRDFHQCQMFLLFYSVYFKVEKSMIKPLRVDMCWSRTNLYLNYVNSFVSLHLHCQEILDLR
jgi:hypothetical protein